MSSQRSLLRFPCVSGLVAVVVAAGLIGVVRGAVGEAPKPSDAATAAELAAAAEEIVKSLEATVSDATAYKQGAEEVEHKGYMIALIANAVPEASGDAAWKAKGYAVRDAALGLAKAKSHANAEKALKDLKGLLGGGSAAAAGSPMPYLEVASLHHVMEEVNDRQRPMRKNLRTFARSKETIARDAQVWALLAAVARADKKSAADAKKPQADYEKYADEFFTSSKSLAEASKKGDEKAAGEALKAVSASCAQCHAVFRPDIE